ncbi:hypothetical protein E4T44_01928 [Aureobasidium sp. EXF-8845]|nr:hypothetical protein E4T44_01928 [Aureobasidium sp. EXF-8845]KAI4856860.1 hypothetical protein E4T45_01660 [Aureobasidium sp. EXF-8846]
MSADQSQQQSTGPDNNTQAALLVPATMTLIVSLLLYGIHIRARRSSPLVYTDGMITAALILAIVNSIFIAISCHYGLGRHTAFVDTARVLKARYFGFLAQPVCVWSICLAKVSIALTALKTRQDREWQWVFCWIIFVQVACTIATNVIQVVQCQPISALWNDDVTAQCWPSERARLVGYVTMGFGVITSMLLSLTPRRQTPTTRIVTMASVANMVYLHTYRTTQDPLRDMIAPTTWWQIEQNLSIIASLAIGLRTHYETLLARCGLICQVRTNSTACHRLNCLEDGSHILKSLKTSIPWGQVYDSTAHLPSIVKTTEVVHSTELMKDDEMVFGSPARRPSWQ